MKNRKGNKLYENINEIVPDCMPKKRDDRAKEKKIKPDRVKNLDGDFISPILSVRDLFL